MTWTYTTLYLALSITIAAILQTVNCDLKILPHEIELTVGSCATLELHLTDAPVYNARVELKLLVADVANVTSTELELVGESVNVSICGEHPGRSSLIISLLKNDTKYSYGTTQISVCKCKLLENLGVILGWTYFIAWSICFYPQMYMNYKKKSVVGLNFDYLGLSLIGFMLYSVYNCTVYWMPTVQEEYFERHPRGMIPVQLSDVEFSIHATLLILIVIGQCFIYERDGQTLSKPTTFILLACVLILGAAGLLVYLHIIKKLDFIYVCSYIKLITSLMKYTPQVILNYRRKSTNGWSIKSVLLDLTGGLLSTFQMLIISYNFDDWRSLYGNLSKFGLGIASSIFDITFIVQHCVLYRHNNNIVESTDRKFSKQNSRSIDGQFCNGHGINIDVSKLYNGNSHAISIDVSKLCNGNGFAINGDSGKFCNGNGIAIISDSKFCNGKSIAL